MKEAFVGEEPPSSFIQGTCFHSYINVVEVRRSGIAASDLLHEACSSPIDFHSSLEKHPTAHCLSDNVEVMKRQNMSEKKKTKEIFPCFEDDVQQNLSDQKKQLIAVCNYQ